MSVIGRREFELIMKMDDQTRREREQLNRGLGAIPKEVETVIKAHDETMVGVNSAKNHLADIPKVVKEWPKWEPVSPAGVSQAKAAADDVGRAVAGVGRVSSESKRSLIDMAKQSKQSVEGIRAVMELGGWLALASGVVNVLGNITEEARKNSQAFKEAGAALDVIGKRAGTSLVKFMEPMISGFTNVMVYGSAVLNHFPEVAKLSFDYVGKIFQKTFSWEGIKTIILAVGEGIITVFRSAFEYLPKLFTQVIQLMFNPIYQFGQYIADTLGKAFTLNFKAIESPGSFMGRVMNQQVAKLGEIASGFGDYVLKQTANIGKAGLQIAGLYASDTKDYLAAIGKLIAPDVAATNAEISGQANKPDAAVQGLLDDWRMKLLQQSGDKLAILDAERAQALAKMRDTLKDADQQGEALKLIDEYYAKARQAVLTDSNTRAIAAAKAQAQEVAQAEKERADARRAIEEKVKADNLAGKNGLGAAVGQNFAGKTEALPMLGGDFGGVLSGIFGQIGAFLPTVQNLMSALNPLQTILQAVFEVLGPVINDTLAPFVDVLKLIGNTVGKMLAPVIAGLKPIIEALAQVFLFLFNWVVRPIYNGLMVVFNAIYNAFADFINGILWLVDQIPFVDVGRVQRRNWDAGTLDEISLSDSTSSGSGTSSGASASYAAGTSIKIEKIEIKADFIAGDAGLQQVAIMLRDQLREAERAGR